MVKKTKKINAKITSRTVVYTQDINKNGKLSKAKPIVLTTVSTGNPRRKR